MLGLESTDPSAGSVLLGPHQIYEAVVVVVCAPPHGDFAQHCSHNSSAGVHGRQDFFLHLSVNKNFLSYSAH